MKFLVIIACTTIIATAAAAADVSLSATLNNQRVSLGDQLVLSVTISGSGSATPKPPLIPDVEIYESGKQQNMSIINGHYSSSIIVTYVLNPRKAGRFVIPPLEIPGAAPTAPIAFNVDASPSANTQTQAPASPAAAVPGTAPAPHTPAPAGSPDAFVSAALDKNRALVNEQVTLVVRFYTAVPLAGAPQYDAPKLTGLLSENLGSEGHGTVVIGGRTYNFSELKTALFPVQAGRSSIGPAGVTVQLPRRGGGTGDEFFDRFFNMAAPEAHRLQTEPLSLLATALPPGAPDDFSGIVGELTVESTADRAQLKAGEALNLTVVVSGSGNIKSLPEPKRPDLPSIRFFDSETSVNLTRNGDKVGGSKTFKMVVVPRFSGPLEIPPLTVSYCDPAKRAYARAKSKPIRLTVLPGDQNAPHPVVGPGGTSPAPGVTEVAADVRYLKAPGGRSSLGDALGAFGAPGPWHALPGLFFLAEILFLWRRRALAANPRARRARDARASVERRLKQAEAQPDAERVRAVALLGEALTEYFADKFDEPGASLTLKSVLHRLQNRKPPSGPAEVTRLKSAWQELDLLRYAPGAAGQAEVKRLADELRALTLAFDKELRS